eukprot:CAMPEP_0113481588 /NCGR_PEP_ID=MMETSP0014_2-20120614/22486_1 /TAXON_ID=2857 /ORGANISM="Nitzschia sp." /LENGTH=751 /DNA_ID=CAMNT_0000375089 /DNA_START=22 /DNA_END=2277 /DNA_ORIENTATION=- /assembly_acc=CAM_ASM_000159
MAAPTIQHATTTSAMEAALSSLQPIRDLSRNWDVDIASCLEEYLHELAQIAPEGVTISTAGQQPSSSSSSMVSDSDDDDNNNSSAVPNFAHAALILQNSSNVYGRKVEYLHSLVYKALEEIFKSAANNSSSSSGGSSGRRGKSTDADIEEFYDFDPHEDFLLLDDVIPEDMTASKKKINLPSHSSMMMKDGSSAGSEDGVRRYSSANTPTDRSLNRTRLSLGGMTVTRLDGSAMGGLSSTSPAQQRALLGILNSGDLRLVDRQCDVGADGTLLIPGSSQQSSSSSAQFGPRQSLLGDCSRTDQNGEPRSLFGEDVSGGDTEMGDAGGLNQDYGGDDDDDGPGFVMNDYGDDNDDATSENNNVVAVQQSKRVRFAAETVNSPARGGGEKGKTKADPWALLDPHSAQDTKLTKKLLRKGRTYRLPAGVEKPPSECVTGSSTTNVTQRNDDVSWKQQQLRPSLIVESFRIAMGVQLEPETSSFLKSKQPFKGLIFGDEFLYIAKENAKKRAAKRRAEKKLQKIASGNAASETGANNTAMYGIDDDEDDNDFGGFDFAGDGDDYDDYGDDTDGAGNAGFGSLDEAFGRSGEDGNQDSNSGKTFEELCQAHIQAFAKGAEKFALNTKLSERVSQWQSRLAPILEEEEQRSAFDIHEYSRVFIEKALDESEPGNKRKSDGSTKLEKDEVVDFGKVTKGCTKRDICRLFLASLSLANAGNLLIQEESSGFDDGEYTFEILSDELHNVMEEYLAPSCKA